MVVLFAVVRGHKNKEILPARVNIFGHVPIFCDLTSSGKCTDPGKIDKRTQSDFFLSFLPR